jgi:hypothetical protein
MAELKVRATLDGSNYQGGIMRLGGLADGLKSRLAAAFTVGAVAAGVRKVMAYADSIEEMSQRVGISAKALQEWSFAAKQNGADAEKLITFIERLTAAAQDLKNAKGFAALGISPEGMTPEQLFSSVQSKTRGRGSPEILAIMDSLGMDIRKTGRMMNMLQADLEAAGQSAERMGAVIDEQTIHALAALNDQISIVGQIIMGQFAPALIAAGKAAIDLFGKTKGAMSMRQFLNPFELGKLLGGDPEAKGKFKVGVKEYKEIQKSTDALIAAISGYKSPGLPTLMAPVGPQSAKFKAQSDSLLSVGNFLGAGRGAIDSLQKEANRIAKDNGRKLDKIADKLPSKEGTIIVP